MNYEPRRHSEPRAVRTPLGIVLVPGPFADDYTDLKWQYENHWSGEIARFRVAGLEAVVRDCDGDDTWWELRDLRDRRRVLAHGRDHNYVPLPHFWKCLVDAEAALREEVRRRVSRLRPAGTLVAERVADQRDGREAR